MVVFDRPNFRTARKAAEEALEDAVRATVQDHRKGAVLSAAMKLSPTPRASRLTQLYELLAGASTAVRVAAMRGIVGRLRAELPAIFRKIPLTPAHFGFANIDQFVKFIGDELAKSGTSASSHAEFAAGIVGWRWNLAGRVLFERLIKFHPQLQTFFEQMAKEDWSPMLNDKARELVNLAGNRVSAVGTFGTPRRVEHFLITGADGVERASADFGYMTDDGLGRVALLPIEIKMPAALAGVAGQFSEFVPRLSEAGTLYAVVREANGELTKVPIKPESLVLLKNDAAQLAVAPVSRKRAEKLLAGKKIARDAIASVAELDQGTSTRHGITYYRARLLVDRSWLEQIVEAITDPPGS